MTTQAEDPSESPEASARSVGAYVVTFNAPDQLEAMLQSWAAGFAFDRLYVIDNSTDGAARERNKSIAAQHHGELLYHPKGNGGVCGARQLAAEHFAQTNEDYCLFLEDDMFLNPASETGLCRSGFRLAVSGLRETVLRILERERYDFLKLSFTEFFGDNRTQFAWYNAPQALREHRWPEKPHLPAGTYDPNAPATVFRHIGTVDGVSYVDGEVYYCNWPHLVSKAGNKRMFLDTVFAHPFEQTWMTHMYLLTLMGGLRPAVLLASVVTHNRFHHYAAEDRREN